ncbi:MAG: hypothetical protein HOC71_06940 [Candidatus Latescibacteria bacterium]|jgi:hypothetical protein|nr:hypothetical protein [Candidatus Latescibacterota bacterium]
MHNLCGIFIMFFSLITYTSRAEEITLDQLQGDWLNKNYIEILKATKSPRKSAGGIYNTFFSISKEDNSYKWLQIYNFHEGIKFQIIKLPPTSEPHTYQMVYEPIYSREPVERETYINTLYIPGDKPFNEIAWILNPRHGSKEGQGTKFIRVEPNINEFVNRIVIAGHYTNEHGQSFVFKETGEAVWPDKSFKYEVGLDSYWTNSKFDAFKVLGEKIENFYPMRYGFEWRDKKLLIYKISEVIADGIVVREEKPLYILTPRNESEIMK